MYSDAKKVGKCYAHKIIGEKKKYIKVRWGYFKGKNV